MPGCWRSTQAGDSVRICRGSAFNAAPDRRHGSDGRCGADVFVREWFACEHGLISFRVDDETELLVIFNIPWAGSSGPLARPPTGNQGAQGPAAKLTSASLAVNRHPILGAPAAGPGLRSQDVLASLDCDSDGGIDGPAGDPAVPYLERKRVYEHLRVELAQGAALSGDHLLASSCSMLS
jgi:hypothetical protein